MLKHTPFHDLLISGKLLHVIKIDHFMMNLNLKVYGKQHANADFTLKLPDLRTCSTNSSLLWS